MDYQFTHHTNHVKNYFEQNAPQTLVPYKQNTQNYPSFMYDQSKIVQTNQFLKKYPSAESSNVSHQESIKIQHLDLFLQSSLNEIKSTQTFNSPVKITSSNDSNNSIQFNTSAKSKLFKQLSNKENQNQKGSSTKGKFITKSSIKKQKTPLKIQFQNQFPKRKPIITPFILTDSVAQQIPHSFYSSCQNNQLSLTKRTQYKHQYKLAHQFSGYIHPQQTILSQFQSSFTDFLTTNKNQRYSIQTQILDLQKYKQQNFKSHYYLPGGYSENTADYLPRQSIQSRLSFEYQYRPSYLYEENSEPYTGSEYLSRTQISQSLNKKSQEENFSKPFKIYTDIVSEKVSFKDQIQYFWNNQGYQKVNQSDMIFSSKSFSPKPEDFIKGKKLGKGMFGEVFLVQHKQTGFICAMKVLSKQFVRTQNVSQQLIQELKIHLFMNHPNIVNVYGFFSDRQNIYILQQICTGGQLFEVLVKRRRISQKRTSYYVKQMVESLLYIHSNQVAHRDIKPQNVLLQFGVVKIADFGWASYSNINQYSQKCGTPLYYSPQVIRGDMYSRAIDNWGVGMICYELIVGNIPWSIWTQEQISKIAEEDFQFPDFISVSTQAKDFIEGTLTKYAKNRLKLQQMLQHPFLQKARLMDYHNESRGNYGEATP